MNAQTIVAANVAARGYRDGWTAEQFVARQMAKLVEETAEAVAHIFELTEPRWWSEYVESAGEQARYAFDDKREWATVEIDAAAIRSELADMQVVLFAAAAALDFDVVQAAIDKSSQDVARGVR